MNPETEFREGLDELASHYKSILDLLGKESSRYLRADIIRMQRRYFLMLCLKRNTIRWLL